MGAFLFQAKTVEGKLVKGEVQAGSENEARVKLRAQKLMPLKLIAKDALDGTQTQARKKKQASSMSFGGSVTPKELQVFTRQFAVLIASGVPVVQSLEAMIGPGRTPTMNNALKSILGEVAKGRRLAECMREHPKIFESMYVNLVHAGEEGGVLDTILSRLAIYIEKSVKLKAKIKGALFYPIAVLVVAAIVVSGLLIFVVPKFVEMFEQANMTLPWLTQQVVDFSDFFVRRWYLILGVIISIPVSLKAYYNTEDGRKTLDAFMLKIPLFGELIRKGAVARFSRTLSTMLAAGVRIVEALDIAAGTAKNYVIECVLFAAKDSISKGRTLSEPFRASKEIPDMVGQMVSVGEATGALDQMLDKVATFYEDEVEVAAGALTSVIEPLMMVFLGSIIAVVVVALYLPIFNLAAATGGG